MPIPQKIIKFLKKFKIKYKIVEHRKVFTAFDRAATLKVSPKTVGKTLAVKLDKKITLILIPADKLLDKQKLKKIAKVKNIDFLKESWMKKNLKGVKVGAISSFGSLWKLPTFVDKSLLAQREVVIPAGDYNFSIKIKSTDLKKLMDDLTVGVFSKTRQ